ncbi:MAG: hypothetical protein DK304_000999 [Chloroflexi bacterium]|jgi:Asp-tRNA(Asn)/Glu-tRNA(Gln) amidotransferase C subunit|nr:MAG: hypothetical protein DK304_000999 [Chloroflexota bacterium]
MADTPRVSEEEARIIARVHQLDLPQDRIESLMRMFSSFLIGFDSVRTIETDDREPTTLVPFKEE